MKKENTNPIGKICFYKDNDIVLVTSIAKTNLKLSTNFNIDIFYSALMPEGNVKSVPGKYLKIINS